MRNIQQGRALVPHTEDERVIGGVTALACQWPSVVDMSLCTGVLVHPHVVLFAGHCGPQGEVQFGNGAEGFTVSLDFEDCEVHPLWSLPGNDIAYCTLPVEVTGVPLVHLLGETEPLPEAGDLVTLVGYGVTEDGATNGYKNYGESPFIDIDEGEVRIGGNGVDACYGDSGGPAMAEMADGTWRVIGITSRADDGSAMCGGISRYTYVPTAAAWVEAQSGIDITPCFDGQVAMECEPSDESPDDPAPEWCDWLEASDETGAPETGDASAGEASGGVASRGTGVGNVPFDDGCACAMDPDSDGVLVLVALGLYLAAKMASSYARP